jgi:predicted membrane protein
MHHPFVSRRRAKVFSVALFLIGLAIISYLHTWWPAIMLVIGLPLAFRQYLLGRFYDMVITLFVFVGVFVTVQFDIWEVLLPVLFATGGVYLLFREFMEGKEETLAEEEDDLNHELEEHDDEEK